ncbi:hypothetical protein HAX54_003871 [Datura stramonium]|uniref:Uncharacterized protein n=1 Tax=Datura stramonium TaxID=4076 RepID=A0ABS8T7D0_DATST|nr:hypothetical protein [Datura stramonium]
MIVPTKTLLSLRGVNYEWHEFFDHSNRFSVGLFWIPVVLIYLMDIQIWYSIYLFFLGAAVGLFDHLGEIRNMPQLRLRFQFFASAIQFNLMPEEQLLNAQGTLKSKFKDAILRLKLREEDILNDREVELLELPQNTWNVRVIRWPCLLLCNEVLLGLSQAKELVDAPDRWLWHKISKYEYRRCAVIEAYDNSWKADCSFRSNTQFSKKDVDKIVNVLQALYEVTTDFLKEKMTGDQLREEGLALQASVTRLLFENVVLLPDPENETFYRKLAAEHYSYIPDLYE